MDVQLSKWGNSLAVRIPADYVKHAGLKEGDALRIAYAVDGGLSLRRGPPDRLRVLLNYCCICRSWATPCVSMHDGAPNTLPSWKCNVHKR
jgi:antitoxin component of MazEF toxin-antitoxin module